MGLEQQDFQTLLRAAGETDHGRKYPGLDGAGRDTRLQLLTEVAISEVIFFYKYFYPDRRYRSG
jgi:hypothetical protein